MTLRNPQNLQPHTPPMCVCSTAAKHWSHHNSLNSSQDTVNVGRLMIGRVMAVSSRPSRLPAITAPSSQRTHPPASANSSSEASGGGEGSDPILSRLRRKRANKSRVIRCDCQRVRLRFLGGTLSTFSSFLASSLIPSRRRPAVVEESHAGKFMRCLSHATGWKEL